MDAFPGGAEGRDPRPDRAQADDAQGLAGQVVADQLALGPVALAQEPVTQGDPASQADHQPEGQLRDGLGAGARHATQVDPAAPDLLQVEVVEAGPGPDQQAQAGRGREDLRADRDAAAKDDRLAIDGQPAELVLRRAERGDDVMSRAQLIQGGPIDRAGDKDPH